MLYLLDIGKLDDNIIEKIKNAERKIFKSEGRMRSNILSVCGRVLLGYILKVNFGIDSFSYYYGANGKPYLKASDLFFNISHSGSMVLCCVSSEEIGCDVEKIREFNPRISERFFAEEENSVLMNTIDRNYYFAVLWTLKESVLKKNGTGIPGGLDSFSFADFIGKKEFFAYDCKFFSCRKGDYVVSSCSVSGENKLIDVDIDEFRAYVSNINLKNT